MSNPIYSDPDTGEIVQGVHRAMAAAEAGIDVTPVPRPLPSMARVLHCPDGTEVEAIQLVSGDSMFRSSVWDAVSEFLGMDPNRRSEHFTLRRPPMTRDGSVEVTLHQDFGSGQQGTAWCDDWLLKYPSGRVYMCGPDEFACLFPDHGA